MATPTSVPRAIEPYSKTAVFTVSYPIIDRPNLYVIPIQVTTGDGTVKHPIDSQRLRGLAIDEFVKNQLRQYCHVHAVQFRAATVDIDDKKMPIDHIIFFSHDQLPVLNKAILALSKSPYRAGVRKYTRNIHGKDVEELIHCSVSNAEVFNNEWKGLDYWKKLGLLLPAILRTEQPIEKAHYEYPNDILIETRPKDESGSHLVAQGSTLQSVMLAIPETELTTKEASEVETLFRTKLKLDPTTAALTFEVDIVSGVKKEANLADVVLSLFGSRILGPGLQHEFPRLKAMLVGLKVVRAYTIGKKVEAGGETTGYQMEVNPEPKPSPPPKTFQMPSNDTASSAPFRTRSLVVQDLKLAGEVPTFWKGNKRYTVAKYFSQVLHKTIKHPTLPLVNIGNDSWVPLEMVKTASTQMLPSSGTLAAYLDEVRQSFKVAANETNILTFGDNAMRPLITMTSLTVGKGSCKALNIKPSSLITKGTHLVKPKENQLCRSPFNANFKPGIIYVSPSNIISTEFVGFADLVNTRLREQCAHTILHQGDDDTNPRLFDIPRSFDSLVAVIPDVKPLLLVDARQNEALKRFHAMDPEQKPNTIIAIIDQRGRTESEVERIRAEVQKFGNRKIGAVTYCTTRQTLETLLVDRREEPAADSTAHRFPQGIMEKLNAMLGGQNYESDPFDEVPKARPTKDRALMIVGAYISHPTSGAAAHTPSVAALVANTHNSLTHYPGSVRLQPTTMPTGRKKQKKTHLAHKVQPQILELENMMRDVCSAWSAKHGDKAPDIIFYRHGLDNSHCNIIEEEIALIRNAIRDAASLSPTMATSFKNATFTYIVVGKDHIFQYRTRSQLTNDWTTSKYKLTVIRDSELGKIYDLDNKDIEQLTQNLNKGYQLGNKTQVALPLPVHYAQKLARHTYNYFHFAVANRYDALSGVARALRYEEEQSHKNEEKMCDIVKEYLSLQKPGSRDGAESSQSNKGDETPKSSSQIPEFEEWEQPNPWRTSLNDTMFYL